VGTVVLIPEPLVAADPYLWVLISLSFPCDQFQSINICFSIQWSGNGAEPCENFVQSVEIIEEIEKNPGEKRVNIAIRLGLPASTLNTIFAKNNDPRTNTEMWYRVQEEKNWQGVDMLNCKRCSSPGISRHGHPIFQLMELYYGKKRKL
jgi:hypothetical protein